MPKETENTSGENTPEVKKKTGTSADHVTSEAELSRQVEELTGKLAKIERTKENEKQLSEFEASLNTLKLAISPDNSRTRKSPPVLSNWFENLCDELDTIFGFKEE